jgi:hypothetical protein
MDSVALREICAAAIISSEEDDRLFSVMNRREAFKNDFLCPS